MFSPLALKSAGSHPIFMPIAGKFITLEGGEGAGKSTQVARLAERLEAKGATVLRLREPGGTALGEQMRAVLKQPGSVIVPQAEALLFAACRAASERLTGLPPWLLENRWVRVGGEAGEEAGLAQSSCFGFRQLAE